MKNILVVGGHSGVGEEVVRQLKSKGTPYGFPDDATQRFCVPTKEQMDVLDEAAIESFIEGQGPFDEIVYCAGVPRLQWAQDLTYTDWIQDYIVNAFGFAKVVGDHLRQHKGHTFSAVAIVSESYKLSMRGSITYATSKSALAAIVKGLARETAGTGTRINGVAPTVIEGTGMSEWIDTNVPIFRDWTYENARKYADSTLVMGRRVNPAEVAEAILFALRGPAYLSGAIIEVTGGKG